MTTYKQADYIHRLRRSLDEKLRSDADFDAFCIDHFSNIHVRFTEGMSRIIRTNILLEHASLNDIERNLQQYKNNPVYLLSSESATDRLIYTITLESDITCPTYIEHEIFLALKRLSGDPSLTVISVKQGSIIIKLDGTEEGYDRIIAAIHKAALKEILGHRIQSIKIERRIVLSSQESMAQDKRVSNEYEIEPPSLELYTNELIRAFIMDIFLTDSMLDAFIIDHFKKVQEARTNTMDRIQKTSLLIELIDAHTLMTTLMKKFPIEFEKCREKYCGRAAPQI